MEDYPCLFGLPRDALLAVVSWLPRSDFNSASSAHPVFSDVIKDPYLVKVLFETQNDSDYAYGMTDAVVEELLTRVSPFEQLVRKLCFHGCIQLSQKTFSTIATLPKVEQVLFSGTDGFRVSIEESGDNTGFKDLAARCSSLKLLQLRRCKRLTDEAMAILVGDDSSLKRSLETIDLSLNSSLTDRTFAILAEFHLLTSLSLAGCRNITNAGPLAFVAALDGRASLLQAITLSRTAVGDSGVSALVAVCPSLRSIDLSACRNITDGVMRALADAHLQSLRKVSFYACRSITDGGLCSFLMEYGGQLQELSLKNCRGLTPAAVEVISRRCSPALVKLMLSGIDLSSRCLELLAKSLAVRNLAFLTIGKDAPSAPLLTAVRRRQARAQPVAPPPKIDGRRLLDVVVSCCASLAHLEVRGFAVEAEQAVGIVSMCPKLQHLDLRGCSSGDGFLDGVLHWFLQSEEEEESAVEETKEPSSRVKVEVSGEISIVDKVEGAAVAFGCQMVRSVDAMMRSGNSKAVLEAGGTSLLPELTGERLDPGKVLFTRGGALCSHLIHIPVPIFKDGMHDEVPLLTELIRQAFVGAAARGCKAVVLPLLGLSSFPLEWAVKAFADAIVAGSALESVVLAIRAPGADSPASAEAKEIERLLCREMEGTTARRRELPGRFSRLMLDGGRSELALRFKAAFKNINLFLD